MRIAVVVFALDPMDLLDGLCQKLLARDNVLQVFTTYATPDLKWVTDKYDVVTELWSWFELKNLDEFDPHKVIIWNGHLPWTRAAFEYFREYYPTLVVERGWLPQKQHNYISTELAAEGMLHTLVREACEALPAEPEILPGVTDLPEDLWGTYHPEYKDLKLPKQFIFIPGQLDHDTSITVSADKFKSIDSLIGFIRHWMPNIPIVVKNHPLDPDKPRPSSVILYKGKLSTNDLMAQATIVAGLTSTCLCEALALGKPVMSWGRWVGRSAAWDHSEMSLADSGEALAMLERELLGAGNWRQRFPTRRQGLVVRCLRALQWDHANPPDWVCDLVEHIGDAEVELLRSRLPQAPHSNLPEAPPAQEPESVPEEGPRCPE